MTNVKGKMTNVKFKEKKEFWNDYKLEDGIVLRTRFILVAVNKVDKTDEAGNPIYRFNGQDVVGVIVDEKDMGEPSTRKFGIADFEKKIVKEDLDFETITISERWNEYELEDGTVLKIKLTLVKVSKTDEFDNIGNPIYLVDTQPIIKGKVAKK